MPQDSKPLEMINDATVLRVLSYLTEDMRSELPEPTSTSVRGANEALDAVRGLLASSGEQSPSMLDLDRPADPRIARRLLTMLLEDPETRAKAEVLLANPPEDAQRSIEAAIAAAVILGGLVTWLQTKLEIVVERKDGKTEYRFHMKKNPTSDSLVRETAKQVARLFS